MCRPKIITDKYDFIFNTEMVSGRIGEWKGHGKWRESVFGIKQRAYLKRLSNIG
jgi:hypothetical protein